MVEAFLSVGISFLRVFRSALRDGIYFRDVSSGEREAIKNCLEAFADESQASSGEDEMIICEGKEVVDERRDGINCLEVITNGLEDIGDEGSAASDKGKAFFGEAGNSANEGEDRHGEPEAALEGEKVVPEPAEL